MAEDKPTPVSTTAPVGANSPKVNEGKTREQMIEREGRTGERMTESRSQTLASQEPGTNPEELAENLSIEIENMPDTGELDGENTPIISVDYEEGTVKPYVIKSNELVAARFTSKEEALSNATRFANPQPPRRS